MHDKVERYAPYVGAGFLLLVGLMAWLRDGSWQLAVGVVVFAVLVFFGFKYILQRRQSDKKGQGGYTQKPRSRPKSPAATPTRPQTPKGDPVAKKKTKKKGLGK